MTTCEQKGDAYCETLNIKNFKRTLVLLLDLSYNKNSRHSWRGVEIYMQTNLSDMFDYWGVTQGDHKRLLTFLIKSENDLDEFMDEFYDGNIIRNMVKYQKHKRKINSISFEEFDRNFKENKKVALELLLQEPLSEHLVDYMIEYNVTHYQLFGKFRKHPNKSYLGLVKEANFFEESDNTYSDDALLII